MNKIETFEQFLATGNAEFSIWNYVINILLTAALAFLLRLLYVRYGNSLSNRGTFSKNFVMLAVTTMIIITIVKSSLALSLGLVGALSIVRFRAAIKEPEELTFLFLNIAIGLGFGADQKLPTIIGFAIVGITLATRGFFTRHAIHEEQNLIISVSAKNPQKDQLIGITSILKEHCTVVSLKRFDENDSNLESSFQVEFDGFDQMNEAKNNLQDKYDNLTISFIDNNLNV